VFVSWIANLFWNVTLGINLVGLTIIVVSPRKQTHFKLLNT